MGYGRGTLATSMAVCAIAIASPAWAQTKSFNVPAQSAATAIPELARQADIQILVSESAVRGKRTRAVKGRMSVEQAVRRLIAGTGLRIASSDGRTFTLALAAAAGAPAAVSAPSPEDDAASDHGGEIVVSARRKDEVLIGVPASITAYSSDFLEKHNIQSFPDYATKIPNVTFQYGQGSDFSATGFSGGRVTTIRGVAGENTTAYYLNDTPIPSSVSPQTLGLDRIEVLKGPQGTLFGASSMGGNLRFITRKPSLTRNSYAVEAVGGFTQSAGLDYGIEALAGVVLIPGVMALDVSLGHTHDSGYITRRFPDPYPAGNLVSKDDQGRSDLFTGSLSLRTALGERLEVTLGALGQDSKLAGYPATYVPFPDYVPVSYTLDRVRDVREYSKDRWGIGSIVIDYDGAGFHVVSSTSYFARRVEEQEDVTEGTNQFMREVFDLDLDNAAFLGRNIVKDRRFTHETRVSFDEGAVIPRLSGIVGVFHQQDTLTFDQPGIVVPALAEAGFDPPYLSNFRFPQHEDNTALFGELYYEIVPKLTLTLGLRQYWITQKDGEIFSTGFFSSPEGDITPARRNSHSGLVPKFVASYEIGDEGTVYASVGKGFRVGGSQPSQTDDFCVPELTALGLTKGDIQSYEPDTLWSYELGAKGRLAGDRLTVSSALFQIDWSNMQQSVFLPDCSTGFISNAGKARIRGGELEVSGRPFAGVPLTVQLGLGYSDGKLLDPGLLPQAANTRLAQVPELTGTIAGYYRTPISESLELFIAADYSYTGSVKVVNNEGGFLTRRPFNIVNGNIGLSFGNSEFLIYGKNLLNEHLNYGDLYANGFERQEVLADGTSQRLPRAAVSRPRQFGLQYRLNF